MIAVWSSGLALIQAEAILAELEIIELGSLRSALNNLLDGNDSGQWPGLMRAIALELWLKTEGLTPIPVTVS